MSFAIQLTVTDEATPILAGLREALEDATALHSAIAAEAEILTRDYIRGIAPSRHQTAESLGAQPTGYLTTVADGVTSRGEADAAVIGLGGNAGGFARAFGDVTITPKKGKYLTIPASSKSYGKRAGEFSDLELLVFHQADSAPVLALGKKGEGDQGSEVFFWLRRKVEQRQDRELLPSDDQYLAAAETGALAYLDLLPG